MMEELTDHRSYLKATQQTDGIAILEGTTTWCSQCKAIAPYVEKLVKQFPEARFYTYDTEGAPDIAQELGVSQMPTFHIFKDGDVEGQVTGARSEELLKKVKEAYGGDGVEVA